MHPFVNLLPLIVKDSLKAVFLSDSSCASLLVFKFVSPCSGSHVKRSFMMSLYFSHFYYLSLGIHFVCFVIAHGRARFYLVF